MSHNSREINPSKFTITINQRHTQLFPPLSNLHRPFVSSIPSQWFTGPSPFFFALMSRHDANPFEGEDVNPFAVCVRQFRSIRTSSILEHLVSLLLPHWCFSATFGVFWGEFGFPRVDFLVFGVCGRERNCVNNAVVCSRLTGWTVSTCCIWLV